MVARKNPRDGVAPARSLSAASLFWVVLLAIGILSALGVLVSAWQRADLRQRFSHFSEHAMETAFHLHDMTLRIATLATDRIAGFDAAERKRSLTNYRVTIAAQYANVAALKTAYFEAVLSAERGRTLDSIQSSLAALRASVPNLLKALGEAADRPELVPDEARLRDLAVAAMRDARALNDAIRYAEALAFIGLRNALDRSGRISIATILSFALISTASLAVMGWAWKAARAREDALREAKASAERLLEREREFVANTSHELRTPVSGLLGMARLLAREPLTEQATPLARHVLDAAEDLADLVGTVLDSQTEGADQDEAAAWLEPAACLSDTVERYKRAAEAQGLGFSLIDETAGLEFLCQRRLLVRIVSALLSNAVKFTERGSIRVELSLRDAGLRVSVADTGIGMDRTTLQHATERFYQAEISHTKLHRGLGLGLWNAKRGAEALGASLGIKSEPERGTEVELLWSAPSRPKVRVSDGEPQRVDRDAGESLAEPTLSPAARPAATAPAQPPAISGRVSAGSEEARRAILVAEDDAINRMTLQYLLGKAGYEVIAAADGAAALRLAAQADYGLALLDISMPYYTGIDVVSSIRKRERQLAAPRVPAFALTGHSTVEDRKACMAAGFDEFITKPYSEAFLLQRISQALTRLPA